MKNNAREEISRVVSKPAVRICRDLIGKKNASLLHRFKAISRFSSPYFSVFRGLHLGFGISLKSLKSRVMESLCERSLGVM